jgi:DNA-directed RNA polymerase beta subunit
MAEGLRVRRNFGKTPQILAIPNLIEIQKRSFERLVYSRFLITMKQPQLSFWSISLQTRNMISGSALKKVLTLPLLLR